MEISTKEYEELISTRAVAEKLMIENYISSSKLEERPLFGYFVILH